MTWQAWALFVAFMVTLVLLVLLGAWILRVFSNMFRNFG